MNICMGISQLYSPDRGVVAGGNINAMLALSEGLSQRGHSLTLVAGLPHERLSDEIRRKLSHIKLELLKLSTRGPMLRNLEFLSRLIPLAFKWRGLSRFDLVHGHSGYAHLSLMTTFLKRILGVPAVHTIYCPMTDRLNDRVHPLLKTTTLVRSYLSQMDRIVVISENIRRSLHKMNLPDEKVVMIRPAIKECRSVKPDERSRLRRELRVKPSDIMVLFVGNFSRAKGLDLLIKAFAQVKRKVSQAKLVYTVERGPKHSDKREKEVRSLLTQVTDPGDTIELGIVPDMALLMASSDLFILPFRETSGPMDYPMSLLEAMAAGNAVISTRVGGLGELIRDGENGLLVEPDDAERLGYAMHRLLTNESLRHLLADQGKIDTWTKFSQDRAARETEKVYEELLCGRHR